MKKTREEIEQIAEVVVDAMLNVHWGPACSSRHKLSDHRLGFLVNWNVILIKDGIKRMVNRL